MLSQQPSSLTGPTGEGQPPIPIQSELLLRDTTSLRLLVILNVCAKADTPQLIALVNRDKHPKVDAEVVERCLTWLEQSGYVVCQRTTRLAMVWPRPLQTPRYSITREGKSVLAEALALLDKNSQQPGG